MATNPIYRDQMEWEANDGDDPDDVGAESSYGLTFTAEDAAVKGVRDVVLPSNLLSALAGASPSAAPGYGLLSSTNPALNVDFARDAVIPGPNSVDATQETLIIDDPLDQTREEEMEDDSDTIACLQLVGVIPAVLDVFKPRCALHIKYPSGMELKNGDILRLREMSDQLPSVAITQPPEKETLLRGNLFTVIMVALDGGQYLNWALVNLPEQSSLQQPATTQVVDYESPSQKLTKGRRQYIFVAYSQSQPFHSIPTVDRLAFDLRSFATAYALDSPVAAVYVTVSAE